MDRPIQQEENKLLLLYIINRMGAMDEQALEQFILENELMDYLDSRTTVNDLADQGLLLPLSDEKGKLFLISPPGMEALEMYETSLPYSRRVQVDELCASWRSRLLKEKQVMAQYMPHRGGCIARLYFLEGGISMADISLELPDTETAKRLCQAWEEDPAGLYNAVLGALGVREA